MEIDSGHHLSLTANTDSWRNRTLDNFAGFGINGCKSFGSQSIALIGPMDNIHLLVGKNNVGKSNTLHAMSDIISKFRTRLQRNSIIGEISFNSSTIPRNQQDDTPLIVSLGLKHNNEVFEPFAERLHSEHNRESHPDIVSLFRTAAYSRGHPDVFWLDFVVTRDSVRPNAVSTQFSEDAEPPHRRG